MAIFGLFSGGKTKNKKAAAKKLASKVMKTKKTLRQAQGKKSKTCEFC